MKEKISADLEAYNNAMMNGNESLCLIIERRYSLVGYPPEIVSVALIAGAEGRDMGQAIDQYIGAC